MRYIMLNFLAMPDQPVELTKMHEEFLRRRVLHSPLTKLPSAGKNSREDFILASESSLESITYGSVKQYEKPLQETFYKPNPNFTYTMYCPICGSQKKKTKLVLNENRCSRECLDCGNIHVEKYLGNTPSETNPD